MRVPAKFFLSSFKGPIGRVEIPVAPRGSKILRSIEVEPSLPADVAKALGRVEGLGPFKSPCSVAGRSGVRHSFTFGYEASPAPNVVGDLVIGKGPVDETKVLSLFIKVYDVGAKHAVLCVVPSLTVEAKKLSNLYKILTVESGDRTRLSTMTSEVLQRLAKNK